MKAVRLFSKAIATIALLSCGGFAAHGAAESQKLGLEAQGKMGLKSYAIPSLGLGVSYQLQDGYFLEAGYMAGSLDVTSTVQSQFGNNELFKDAFKSVGVSSNDFSLQMRSVLASSFSFFGGFGYRRVGVNAALKDDAYTLAIADRAFSVQAGFGNRWSWDSGFVLGVDWVGISQPLVSTTAIKRSINTEGFSIDDREVIKKIKAHSDQLAITKVDLANIYVGYAF